MKVSTSFPIIVALVLLLVGLNAWTVDTARAASFIRVTVDGATSGACGGTWDAACGLQHALKDLAVSGDELWVAAGVYTPTAGTSRSATFQLKNGVALYGGFAGTENARGERNVSANPTILSGELGSADNYFDNSFHVVTGSGTNSTAVLDGFTVRDGCACANWPEPALQYTEGGGMFNDHGSPTLANVTFASNSASEGGGMFNSYSNPTLTNVTFSRNGICGMVNLNSSPTLTNVTFSHNASGGMYNSYSSPTLTNVTFSNNSTGGYGGGMFNSGGSPTLTNVTFSFNSANGHGGGVFNSASSPTIRNAIFWGNTADTGLQIDNNGGTVSISDSVIDGGCPPGSTCSNIITTNPRLGTLGNYGGSTQTVPLLPGSSAIDAGNDVTCASDDQRGITRAGQGAHCDMGAFESRGFALDKTGGDNQSAEITTSFPTPLGLSVVSGYGEPVNGGAITFSAPLSGASTNPTTTTATISSSAVSRTVTANNSAGSYIVTATTLGVSAPVTFALTNLKASTTTMLASSANPSLIGQSVILTATVGGVLPTGLVTFKDEGTDITDCLTVSLTLGSAACTVAWSTTGSHSITAVYSGDERNTASTSAALNQIVKANTTTTLNSSANPSVIGQVVTFTSTVSVAAPGSGTPSGTVQFKADGVKLGVAADLSGGRASVTTAALSAGTHVITAEYGGSGDLNASSGTLSPNQVVRANSSIWLTTSADSSALGETVTFVAMISGTSGTGSVTFKDGGTNLSGCVTVPLTGTSATCSVAALTVGNHSITAVYSGDDYFVGSSSNTLSHRVYPLLYVPLVVR